MRLIKFIKTNDLIKQYIIRIILNKLILNLWTEINKIIYNLKNKIIQ